MTSPPQYPAYPQQYPAPPPRRNTALVVAILVGSLVLAGTAIGITIALSGNGSDTRSDTGADTTATGRPRLKLPPGCELLTEAQVASLMPGEVDTSRSSGPDVTEESTRSECSWSNWQDPGRTDLPQVSLDVSAVVVTSDEALENTMHYSLGCQDPDGTAPEVAGADESCVSHSVTDATTGAPVDSADVTARHRMLVVEVHYSYAGLSIDRVDVTATNTAAAVIGGILQEQ